MKSFISDDEEKIIKEFVDELLTTKSDSDFLESGGLRVDKEVVPKKKGEKWLFGVYRLVGFVERTKK